MQNKKPQKPIILLTLAAFAISCQLQLLSQPINPIRPEPAIETESSQISPSFALSTITPSLGIEMGEQGMQGLTTDTPEPSIEVPPALLHTITAYPQAQTPLYLVNFLHPELDCQWTGVAGQVFNLSGTPVNGLVVEVSGNLEGKKFLAFGLTGLSRPIGPGGFEVKIADHPFDSYQTLSLRLYNQNGTQLNETFPLITYNDCQKNLILINYVLYDQPLREKIHFPLIFH